MINSPTTTTTSNTIETIIIQIKNIIIETTKIRSRERNINNWN